MNMIETTTEINAAQDAQRPVERLVIFFRSLFTRTYFYSGEIHMQPAQVKHIDGVLQITSLRRQPKLAWQTARKDIIRAIPQAKPDDVHILMLREI